MTSSKNLRCLCFVFSLTVSFIVVNHVSGNENPNPVNMDDGKHLQLFQKLFEEKRKEQKTAIEALLHMNDYSKQYKMIEITVEKIFQVLGSSQEFLRKAGYIPGENFPDDEETRNALAQTLETTCLLGEVVLHLPDVTHRVLKKQEPFQKTLLAWGVFFTAQSSFLPLHTKKLVHLMTQELGLAEKDPNYVNPYAVAKKKQPLTSAKSSKPKKKKKKTFKKGPSLSRHFGDL